MSTTYTPPPLMPHAERRKLIEYVWTFNVYGAHGLRGGTSISYRPLPTRGRRRYSPTPDDENYYYHPAENY